MECLTYVVEEYIGTTRTHLRNCLAKVHFLVVEDVVELEVVSAPRNFIITPNGKYLLVACRDTNVIQIFERDQATGLLTDIKKDIKVDKPVCLKFVD